MAPPGKLRICIVSRKDLHRITRIPRQAQALVEAGHEVVVYCLGLPDDELRRSAPGVTFRAVETKQMTAVTATEIRTVRRLAGLEALPLVPPALLRVLSRARQSALGRPTRPAPAPAPEGSETRAAGGAMSQGPALDARRVRSLVRDGIRIVLSAIGGLWRMVSRRGLERRGPIGKQLAAVLRTSSAADILFIWMHLANRLNEHALFAASVLRAIENEHRLSGWRPDVAQAHDTHAIFAGAAVSCQLRIPLVYDAVEIPEHQITAAERPAWADATDLVIRAAEKPIIAEAAQLITIGDSLAGWYAKHHVLKSPPVVVRNSRYYSEWTDDRRLKRDCGITDGTPLVVWFGGASPHRGLEFIVDVLPHLEEFHAAFLTEFKPYWEPFRRKLLAMIESRGVGSRIHILPMRQPNDLISYASGGDVGVFCFTGEVPLNVTYSLPNKFFEMVMARLPIAATPLEDVGKIIGRLGNGIELRPDCVVAAEAIRGLSARRREPAFRDRLEAAARELCWEQEKRSLTGVYEDIAKTVRSLRAPVP